MTADDEIPSGPVPAERLRHLVGRAVLAPSSHNSQPWLFRTGDGMVEVFADRRRALPVADPHDRALTISCGAAVGTLEAAARGEGIAAEVETLPEGPKADLLARVHLRHAGPPDEADAALAGAIDARRTDRRAFAADAPPGELLAAAAERLSGLGVQLGRAASAEERGTVAELVAEGDRRQFQDPSFRRELASWVHIQRLGSRDGMSSASFGVPDLLAPVARFVLRTFDIGDGTAAEDAQKIRDGSPLLLLLATDGDGPADWLATGRGLADLLLRLTAEGWTASYLNQPIEVEDLRGNLASAFGTRAHPQILLRVGHGGPPPDATPRRDLSEVMLA